MEVFQFGLEWEKGNTAYFRKVKNLESRLFHLEIQSKFQRFPACQVTDVPQYGVLLGFFVIII